MSYLHSWNQNGKRMIMAYPQDG